MKLLALEAGGARLSAALFDGSNCVGGAYEEAQQRPAERMAPMIQRLLDQAGWKAGELGLIAAGRGPGSFTGLRSSLALGQGLSLASGATLVGVDTLEAWAESSGLPKVAVALDGRRGQVYFARYRRGGNKWSSDGEPALMDLQAARDLAQGWSWLSDLENGGPQGADLAKAVGRLALAGPARPWDPLYMRRAEVEIQWEKLHPKA
jgi:tRNA threonylcarbamoyladenosine biosynthesis protein TsaB